MKIPFVDLKAQYQSIKQEIDTAIQSVIEDAAFIKGPYVEKFENEFSTYLGLPHTIGVGNGTDAIEIALKALAIGPGDEVIVPAHTWISTAEAVSYTGAKVVFSEVDADNYCLDPSLLQEKLTSKTKAIIAVHLYGHPAPMAEINKLAKENNLFVIEDCAQAHGAKIDNQLVGTMSDVATFSFFPGKNLGAYGDAGAIVTKDSELAEKCRMLANHGRLGKFDHAFEGRNSRLDGLQASILSVKLKHLEAWTEKRIAAAKKYCSQLEGTNYKIPTHSENIRHVYHLFVIEAEGRDALRDKLSKEGIATGIHYPVALPFLKAYESFGHSKSDFPVSSSSMNKILSLPIYPEISDEQIAYICESLRD